MKHTVPAAHDTFGQIMTSFEHTLYANFHHIQYLPLILFVFACGFVAAPLLAKQSTAPTRAAFYLIAVLLVVACIFIL
jgi:uncharacterized transporter YbjL